MSVALNSLTAYSNLAIFSFNKLGVYGVLLSFVANSVVCVWNACIPRVAWSPGPLTKQPSYPTCNRGFWCIVVTAPISKIIPVFIQCQFILMHIPLVCNTKGPKIRIFFQDTCCVYYSLKVYIVTPVVHHSYIRADVRRYISMYMCIYILLCRTMYM